MKTLNLHFKNFQLLLSMLSIFIFLSIPNYLFSQTILYGDSITLGNGVVRTFVHVNAGGTRDLIGVSMTAGVLDNLDTVRLLFVLNLPVTPNDTLVNHVFFGWNPVGHGPPGVWDDPHFDFHFVTVSRAERESVIPGPDSVLEAQFTPTDHFYDPIGAVPFHGTHWADSTDPAFHGGAFTKTMIYGFYRGKIFFYEPMITRAYLLTNPDVISSIKQPLRVTRDWFFPRQYRVMYNTANQTYNVVLQDFLFKRVDDPLPVELSSFVSLVKDRNVKLNWTTSMESNNSGFDVERSNVKGQTSNGWEKIGFVQGNGTTSLPSGVYFYKLTVDGNIIDTKRMVILK